MVMEIIIAGDVLLREDSQEDFIRMEVCSLQIKQFLMTFWGTLGFSTLNVEDGEPLTIIILLISIIGQGVWELKLDGVSSSKRMITYFKSEIILHIS